MTKAEIIEIANEFISEGELGEALVVLSTYAKGMDRYVENDLLMQMASYNRNSRDYNNGLMTQADYRMVTARLNYALTQIVDRLPETGNHVERPKTAAKPVVSITPQQPQNEQPVDVKKRTILFLSSNPKDQENLRLGDELQKIKDGLRAATQRDMFKLESEPAVKVPTITMAMQLHAPEIVHFSGHGYGKKKGKPGLVVQNDAGMSVLFPTEGLDMLFELFKDSVKCVVLNACYSKEHAETISKHGIYVVGMDDEIGDAAAVNFSVGFYQSIGEGKDVKFAFKIALINISPNLNDAHRPELWFNGEKVS